MGSSTPEKISTAKSGRACVQWQANTGHKDQRYKREAKGAGGRRSLGRGHSTVDGEVMLPGGKGLRAVRAIAWDSLRTQSRVLLNSRSSLCLRQTWQGGRACVLALKLPLIAAVERVVVYAPRPACGAISVGWEGRGRRSRLQAVWGRSPRTVYRGGGGNAGLDLARLLSTRQVWPQS